MTKAEPRETSGASSDTVCSKLHLSHFLRELTTLGRSSQFSYKVRESTEAVHRMIVESPSTASPSLVCHSIPQVVFKLTTVSGVRGKL